MNCTCGHDIERHLFVDFGDEKNGCDMALCECPIYYEDLPAEVSRYTGD